jgi:hypothetical protein
VGIIFLPYTLNELRTQNVAALKVWIDSLSHIFRILFTNVLHIVTKSKLSTVVPVETEYRLSLCYHTCLFLPIPFSNMTDNKSHSSTWQFMHKHYGNVRALINIETLCKLPGKWFYIQQAENNIKLQH